MSAALTHNFVTAQRTCTKRVYCTMPRATKLTWQRSTIQRTTDAIMPYVDNNNMHTSLGTVAKMPAHWQEARLWQQRRQTGHQCVATCSNNCQKRVSCVPLNCTYKNWCELCHPQHVRMLSPKDKFELAYVRINVNKHPTGASPWYVFELGGAHIPMQNAPIFTRH